MTYDEPTSHSLSEIFKCYKRLQYTNDTIAELEESMESCFTVSALTPKYGGIWNKDAESRRTALYTLPTEDFFILRGLFSEEMLNKLLFASLIHWPQCVTKACNLSDVSSGNTDIWSSSVSQVMDGIPWDRTFMGKLRWITLGYHYQWGIRRYSESLRGDFPELLSQTSTEILKCLTQFLKDVPNTSELVTSFENFVPEAAIVNYYRKKMTMGFHSDEVEFDKSSPLISFSLGSTGLYLLESNSSVSSTPPFPHLGRPNIDSVPNVVPVLLHHGDCVVMAGKSRLAKHAVPSVLFGQTLNSDVLKRQMESSASQLSQWLVNEGAHDPTLYGDRSNHLELSLQQAILSYLNSTRININVRQVVPSGHLFSEFKQD